ncbi:c-type cytochrome [Robbsia sp. Bb-Pol-6]|uniref:C-type cytochrome n=1 Tax=Robbsia betulipollinis TaxID=2981849 RepID=A0ABT3ZJB5_9BURK|nr:c-type cytochrome [Robbsia betulipollinis]MCY0386060.1 c-type cytochrome [Robbsia betulipollinis]
MATRNVSRRMLAIGAPVLIGIAVLAALVGYRGMQAHRSQGDPALLERIAQYGRTAGADADAVTRGKYLAAAGDCIACHTAANGKAFAGGLALNTPFGKIVASNITPDKTYGIGAWSDAQFVRAVKAGVAPHAKLLYPAMPYNLYAKVGDEDILDILAYLKTVPAVHEPITANALPFPFNIRLLMFGWNLLFFDRTPFQPDPKQSVEWNRGAYLVAGLGHCTACHSAKNALGGDSDYLEGGDLEGWHAPEISGNGYLGLGKWSVADITTYLHTGGNRVGVAAGPMSEAVTDSLQFMNAADLKAMAVYLKSVPGSGATPPAPLAAGDATMALGRDLYRANCAACHRANGAGVDAMVPSLAANPGVQAPGANNVIRTILVGGRGAVTGSNPTGAQMPGFAWKLSDAEIAALATYVRNDWGNAAAAVGETDVARLRHPLDADTQMQPHPALSSGAKSVAPSEAQ